MQTDRVVVISDTIQEFCGERYYLCGFYFQHKGKRLHRAVWEHFNGPIAKGYHVHHMDRNRANNSIENLLCQAADEHESNHGHAPDRQAYGKMHIERIRPKAVEWHKSPEGLAWHSEVGKQNYAQRKMNTYRCTYCGKDFQTKHVYAEGKNRFCGNNCRAKHLRKQRREATA